MAKAKVYVVKSKRSGTLRTGKNRFVVVPKGTKYGTMRLSNKRVNYLRQNGWSVKSTKR